MIRRPPRSTLFPYTTSSDLMTLRASDELYISIPFVKFSPMAQKKKDLLLDASILSDPRLIDLATSGIIDHHLVIPRFLIKDLSNKLLHLARLLDANILTSDASPIEMPLTEEIRVISLQSLSNALK